MTKIPDDCYLTEQMTDEEIFCLTKLRDETLSRNFCNADYYFSRINPALWTKVRQYMEALEEFYEGGAADNAE
jgi:hypothetical protein